MKNYSWICPHSDCKGSGKKQMSKWKAARHGRLHLKRIHNDWNSDPIIIKVECEADICG